MNIRTVRRAAQDLRIALNTDEWRNRLDALGMGVVVTNGPWDHYEYGVQIMVIRHDLRCTVHAIPDMQDGGADFGILRGSDMDFNRIGDIRVLRDVSEMRNDLYREIAAAFGCEPVYAC